MSAVSVSKRSPGVKRAGARNAFYSSKRASASAANARDVTVKLSIGDDTEVLERLEKSLAGVSWSSRAAKTSPVIEAIKEAAGEFVRAALSQEFDNFVGAYRLMLQESLARGEDRELKSALNRARLQERILASTPMADQGQACELLGLSGANPSATMKRKEDRREVLRFQVDGRAAYPLFQFDVEARDIYPVMPKLIAQKPAHWSDFRLLHWLTRPHADFDAPPSEVFGSDAEAVVAAFERAIEPVDHG